MLALIHPFALAHGEGRAAVQSAGLPIGKTSGFSVSNRQTLGSTDDPLYLLATASLLEDTDTNGNW